MGFVPEKIGVIYREAVQQLPELVFLLFGRREVSIVGEHGIEGAGLHPLGYYAVEVLKVIVLKIEPGAVIYEVLKP